MHFADPLLLQSCKYTTRLSILVIWNNRCAPVGTTTHRFALTRTLHLGGIALVETFRLGKSEIDGVAVILLPHDFSLDQRVRKHGFGGVRGHDIGVEKRGTHRQVHQAHVVLLFLTESPGCDRGELGDHDDHALVDGVDQAEIDFVERGTYFLVVGHRVLCKRVVRVACLGLVHDSRGNRKERERIYPTKPNGRPTKRRSRSTPRI